VLANGISTSVAAIASAAPQSTTFVTAAVLLFDPLIEVWLKRSRAKPVTRTTSPSATRFALPVKT
jgi:hypothetical protein